MPSNQINVTTHSNLSLVCLADSNPPPSYKWLQKLQSGQVIVRGNNMELTIPFISFEHIGEFVCIATNNVKSITKSKQSEPIKIDVRGPPLIKEYNIQEELLVQAGDEVKVEVHFC